jgi:aspartyl-tRNA(Asn)/glutamyl-tRNA(Gln) amidotransferase subunit C
MDCERRWPNPEVTRALRVALDKVTFMSNISRDDVANLAKLARIEMSDQELDHLSQDPLNNVFRNDEVRPSLTASEALSGAPAQEGNRFKVPQILGEE